MFKKSEIIITTRINQELHAKPHESFQQKWHKFFYIKWIHLVSKMGAGEELMFIVMMRCSPMRTHSRFSRRVESYYTFTSTLCCTIQSNRASIRKKVSNQGKT
jgi:hypothetical protein